MQKRILALAVAAVSSAIAQIPNREAVIHKLESTYNLTQPTADNTEIVTAGAVLVLKRNQIVMNPVSSAAPYQNIYKDGRLMQNALGRTLSSLRTFGVPASNINRTFVRGEKMWVTNIEVHDDGVVFSLFSDPYAEVRYKAALRFAIEKGTAPTTEQIENMIAEVFRIQPAEEPATNSEAASRAPVRRTRPVAPAGAYPAQAAAEAPAEIPPPPPPPADAPQAPPKSISMGQTMDQVKANFGSPKSIVDLGKKQIYVYDALKVTFMDGKVSDVQ